MIGAGTMGAGIAQVAAGAGHPVRVIDLHAPALERGRAAVAASLAALVKRGTLDEAGRSAIEERITWSSVMADAAGGMLAVEAIVERLDVKVALFRDLAGIMGDAAVLASNTSSLSIAAMAQGVPGPNRFLGLHFFNPVPAMKLVEVVAGPSTDPAIAEDAQALMTRWRKRPVAVRDVPGFIVNRVARPYYAEGFAALGEGIAPALIDQALTGAGGFRMGPLALSDLIGQDVNHPVAVAVFEAYGGATRFRPQPAQQALVQGGRLGRKSGGGVYDYGAPLAPAPVEAPAPIPAAILAPTVDGPLAALVAAAEDAGLPVRHDADVPADRLHLDGKVLALGDGALLKDREDVDILLDWARDWASATMLAFTARDDAAAATASGFVQALGRGALRLPDRPGQLVLRTLAQLANAAADAVTDAVARGEGIDEAMVNGANHPEGPLAWAARAGHATVADALDRIAGASGEAMYRAAPLFRARAA